MKKLLAAAVLVSAFPLAHAQTVGDAVGEAGREVKKGAHAAHDVVWTRCKDGRQTVKGKSGCRGHGGVAHNAESHGTPPKATEPKTDVTKPKS